jgi:ubiquitin-conjugating enzyme E2 variant
MVTLKALIWIGVQLVLCLMLTDFMTGAFHWLEDSYGSADWPIVGPAVIEPNLEHHERPRAMVANSWFESAKAPLGAVAVIGAGALAAGVFSWQLGVILLLGANANEVHKWAHRTRRENSASINWLHDRGWLQTPRHHGMHHGGKKDSHYCILTNALNPMLDRLGFWRWLERALERISGIAPRAATA